MTAQAQVTAPRRSLLRGLAESIRRFFKILIRNKAGFLGFCGLVFYLLLITVGPRLVPFDAEVKLDQIAAPPGSRDQLLTRRADAETYTSLESLAGRTVGVVRDTGR